MNAPQRYVGGRKRKNADLERLLDMAYYHQRGECLSVPSIWNPEQTPKWNNKANRKDENVADRGVRCPFCDGVEDVETVRDEYRGRLGWDWVTSGRLKVIGDQIEESRLGELEDPMHQPADLVQNVAVWLSERPEQHHEEHWAAATRMHVRGKDLTSRVRAGNPPSKAVPYQWWDDDGERHEAEGMPTLPSAEDVYLAKVDRASMNRYGCRSEPCELDLRLSTTQAVWCHELLDAVTDEHGETGMTDAGFKEAAAWLTRV